MSPSGSINIPPDDVAPPAANHADVNASADLTIIEGRGHGSDADFARFLIIARGSNTELAAQLTFAVDLGLLDPTHVAAMIEQNTRCGKMLSALIARLWAG